MFGRELLALGLAHAVAVVLVSYCHYVVFPPNRLVWFVAELGLAVAIWPLARWFVRRIVKSAFEITRRSLQLFILFPIGLGFFVSRWWAGSLTNTLWVHEPAILELLEFVLLASESAVLAAAYAGLLAVTLAVDGAERVKPEPRITFTRNSRFVAIEFILLLVIANAFTVWYVRQERTIYYWDYMGYWTKTAELANNLQSKSATAFWDEFRHSTQTEDYGPIPAMLPAIAVSVFGDTRLVYELAVVNLYVGGLALAVWLFVSRFGTSSGWLAAAVPVLAVLCSPLVWVPVLRGYLDIGGAVLATLILTVYLSRLAGELPWPRILLLAGLLVGLVLFRRWYSFFVVSFMLVAGVDTALAMVRMIRTDWKVAVRMAGRFVLVGVWAAVLLISFAAGWVRRVATTDYSADYTAYKTLVPLGERVLEWFQTNGPLYVSASIVSFAVLLLFRDTRRVALMVGVMTPIILLHFLRVQNFGPHHDYLFLPAFILLPSLALVRLLANAPLALQWIGLVLATAVGIVLIAIMFVPAAQLLREPLRPVVSTWYYPPLVRNDLDEFRRLLRATEATARTTGNGKVAVVASSLTLNGSMFIAADHSLGEPLLRYDRLVLDPDIDVGFPAAILHADVAVVATPTQTHLRLSEQQGVVLSTASLVNRIDIGLAFERLPGEYRLGDDVEVRVYRRTRPTRPDELAAYCERLRQAHPDRPAFFKTPPEVGRLFETKE